MTVVGAIPRHPQPHEWAAWKSQPTHSEAGQFLVAVFRREHDLDRRVSLGSQIMGIRVERRRYAGIAVAGILELDALLKQTACPTPQQGEMRTAALKRGAILADQLHELGNEEGAIGPDTYAYITTRSERQPSRVVYLAQLVSEGLFPDYPGLGRVAHDATLAIQLQHANSIDTRSLAASVAPISPAA